VPGAPRHIVPVPQSVLSLQAWPTPTAGTHTGVPTVVITQASAAVQLDPLQTNWVHDSRQAAFTHSNGSLHGHKLPTVVDPRSCVNAVSFVIEGDRSEITMGRESASGASQLSERPSSLNLDDPGQPRATTASNRVTHLPHRTDQVCSKRVPLTRSYHNHPHASGSLRRHASLSYHRAHV
jgi:hypothetical protein